jgi:subtilisin family serine protease
MDAMSARKSGILGMIVAAAGLLPAFALASTGEFKAGEVLVKYKDGAFRSRISMNALYDAAGVQAVKHLNGLMSGMDHITLADGVKVQDAIASFMKSDAVEYAQPNYILRTLPVVARPAAQPVANDGPEVPCLIPGIPFPPGCKDTPGNPGNPGEEPPTPPATRPDLLPSPGEIVGQLDPDLGKAYGLAKIGAVDAWKQFRGAKPFIVADIDTGIDYNHEDLAFNVWRNPNPTQGDVAGFDFVHNDGLPFDDNQHGTHTAGTIGAVGGNGKAISGVIQSVSLMSLKFLSGEGSGTTADAVKAIDYAVAHGAKVLSNSWGGKGDDGNQALEDAIKRARDKDVLFIAAAGNDSTDNDRDPSYPAAFTVDNMISVAATDSGDGMAFFSNYGKRTTHLAAPGVNVYSTVPGNKYAQLSGTSMACPHVAGAAALLWAKHPTWNYKQVKEALLKSVDPVAALQGKTITGGRLNILKALRSTE